MNNQSNKKQTFIEENVQIDLVPLPKTDDDTIITVKPPFNACFDDMPLLSKHVTYARTKLPDRLQRCKHIIANKGVSKINALFNLNGM